MSFHLDYRPKSWDEFIGCSAMIEGLQNKVKDSNRPHTYLFIGEGGTGKTSAARLFVNEVAESSGKKFNIEEVNASADNGVNFARELEQKANRRMIGNMMKFFIMDECHKLTNDAQNVLLKVIEEPPEDTYFLFITTDPQKLLSTFKSRCTTYHTSKPDKRELVQHLEAVVAKEQLDIDRRVLSKIATASNHSPREALTMLNSIVGVEDVESQIKAISGNTEQSDIADLCKSMLYGNTWKGVTDVLRTIKGEPESVRRGVLGYLSAILMKKDDGKVATAIDIFSKNVYDSGKAGLLVYAYETFKL